MEACPNGLALFNVAVPRFRACGHDAEGHDGTVFRQRHGLKHFLAKGRIVVQCMIRRQHQHQGIFLPFPQEKGRDGNGRGRIARLGLKKDVGLQPAGLQPVQCMEAVCFVTDHNRSFAARQRLHAAHRLRKEGGLFSEVDKLLGAKFPRERP